MFELLALFLQVFVLGPVLCASVLGLIANLTVLRGWKDEKQWSKRSDLFFWGGWYVVGFAISLIWTSNDRNQFRGLYKWVESWGVDRLNIVIGISLLALFLAWIFRVTHTEKNVDAVAEPNTIAPTEPNRVDITEPNPVDMTEPDPVDITEPNTVIDGGEQEKKTYTWEEWNSDGGDHFLKLEDGTWYTGYDNGKDIVDYRKFQLPPQINRAMLLEAFKRHTGHGAGRYHFKYWLERNGVNLQQHNWY